ncbi:Uncharacterised protein [Kluyvera cryocrescens]|uniref:Uncharacterized protein n=1 Tax=Kluyvera cryocrescens TaxID=580 RepID=A0A485AE51_KLUCR|nr:Uncharacterised protein [Kluyvera cryocrescens]
MVILEASAHDLLYKAEESEQPPEDIQIPFSSLSQPAK